MSAAVSVIRILAHLLAIGLLMLYLNTEVYKSPERMPFEGDVWHNPYAGSLNNEPLRANFHAHTRTWSGVTFGENSEDEMIRAYSNRGYDIIGISNYHQISTHFDTSELYIPVYEHGLNVLKVHNLAIGASEVILPLFPLHWSVNQTQQMLKRTAVISRLNALCHPTMSRIAPRKMSKLTGYDLLEVGNTLGMSVAHWDSALSAGHLVWILSNDDTHDLVKEPTFIKWNMIYAEERNARSAIDAMTRGAHYGVESYNGICENTVVQEYGISKDTLHITLGGNVNRIDLYGQDGGLLASKARTNRLSYKLAPDDTYVRSEIHMDECVYYFNPIVRTTDGTPTLAGSVSPVVNTTATWMIRVMLCLIIIILAVRTFRITSRSLST